MRRADTMTSVQKGDDVYGSDGDNVGTVADVQPTYLVAHKDAGQHTEQVRGAVRREEVEVIDEGLMADRISDLDPRA